MDEIALPFPLSLAIKNIYKGEMVLVEHNTAANIDLLPIEIANRVDGVLIEIGDRIVLKTKVFAERGRIKNFRGKIICISNFPLTIEGIDVINIPRKDMTAIHSELYNIIKNKKLENNIFVLTNIELTRNVYWDFLMLIESLRASLPRATFFGFVNFNAFHELPLLESGATTVIRVEGVVKKDSIRRRVVVLKSLVKPEKEVVWY